MLRQARLKERKMYAVIREIIFHYLFLCVVLLIAYGNRDYWSYPLTNEVESLILKNVTKVSQKGDFWDWAEDILLPSTFPDTLYNGRRALRDGMLESSHNRLVSGVRLRQVRVKADSCDVTSEAEDIIGGCIDEYSVFDEEDQDFVPGWGNMTTYLGRITRHTSPWRYQSWTELDTYPYYAQTTTYNGGGYVVDMFTGDNSQQRLNELKRQRWLDRYTRSVFVEFTVYNADINLFCVETLVFEFLPVGGVVDFHSTLSVRFYRYVKGFAFFVMTCEFIFLFYISVFFFREYKKIYRMRKDYFKEFWNVIEFSMISLSFSAIVIYFYRMTIVHNMMDKVQSSPNMRTFVNFQYAAYWDELLSFIVAIVVCLATMKLNKLLRFNKRMSLLASTLKHAAYPLALFGIPFGIIFGAFALFGWVVFGTTTASHRTFIQSCISQMTLILGGYNYQALEESNRILGPLYYFSYVVLVTFILVNMFLSIIIESFYSVKHDNEKQSNEYEIVDFIIERFKSWAGIGLNKEHGFKKTKRIRKKGKKVKWEAARTKIRIVQAINQGKSLRLRPNSADYIDEKPLLSDELEDRINIIMERTDGLFQDEV